MTTSRPLAWITGASSGIGEAPVAGREGFAARLKRLLPGLLNRLIRKAAAS